MCRILVIVGHSLSILPEIVEAFNKASECDPYLTELLNSRACESQGDGWGYTVVGVLASGEEVVDYYRTARPVFKDPHGLGRLKSFTEGLALGVAIAHSRRAAVGSIKVRNTHPIHYAWKEFEMWIAHNGVVDAEAIARDAEIPKVGDATDTYYLGEFIYRAVRDLKVGDIVKSVVRASKYTKTAMNTAILFYTEGRVVLVVTSYLAPERLSNAKAVNYYKLYQLETENALALFSSSILKYYSTQGGRVSEVRLQSGVAVELNLREPTVSVTHFEI